jgi:pyruvate/2-oxoglutarate dehydrogenase complex dihydrolipoamide dehydrogenase (E3) component
MAKTFDALIIGTGQAGPSLAARLAGAGMHVALVEKGEVGGTCVNNGCTPTKAMIASAYAAHMTRRATDYGVRLDGAPQVEMQRFKARKDEIVDTSRSHLEEWIRGLDDVTVYRGHARFTGRNAVQVDGESLAAEKIFVDVGGRPLVPKMPGLDGVPYLTNVTMMSLDVVPPHLLVIGGSYVGLEFAQMMRRFGSRITVVEMGPRLVGREDEDVSLAIESFLDAEGIMVRTGAECVSVRKEPDGVSVGIDCENGTPREHGTHVLLAVGEDLRTSNPAVWALGDCNGKGAFTHTAYNDYEIVADNLLSNAGRKYTDRVPVYALYTDPPLGRVGMNEAEIRKAGIEALVGKRPMTRVARAVEKGETLGFLKIHIESASKRILGASLLGVGADEAVHSLIDAVYAQVPYTEFQRRVRIHPNVSELLPTVLEDLKPLD